MSGIFLRRYAAQLELSTMNDVELQKLAGDIALAAKTSALVAASPPMQASVAAIATKSAAHATATKLVDDDHTKLRIDTAAAALTRSSLVGEVRTFGSLVAQDAKSPVDVRSAGLPSQGPRPTRAAAPTVPDQIVNKPPKKGHGRTTVSVHHTGSTSNQYVAEQSTDGVTWTQLGTGYGKTRVVTGASGTKVWVRFAMVRGGAQSDWSIPIQVVIP